MTGEHELFMFAAPFPLCLSLLRASVMNFVRIKVSDSGQTRAAYGMGLSNIQTFIRHFPRFCQA